MINLNLQMFAQDRVLGSKATIAFYTPTGPVNIAEVDSFTPTRKSSQKQFQPLGEIGERTQDIYEGYTFTCNGGVIDPSYEDIVDQIDAAAMSGSKNLRFRVTETVEYFDGTSRTYVYPDAVLYNFKKDIKSAKDEITWSFDGAAQTRIAG